MRSNLGSFTVNYSCGVSKTTKEYSCLCVCLFLYMISQKNYGSIHFELEHIVVYENSSDEFDIGHCPIKVKVTDFVTLQFFSIYHNTNCQVLYILALAHVRKL